MNREPVNSLDAFWREFSKNQRTGERQVKKLIAGLILFGSAVAVLATWLLLS